MDRDHGSGDGPSPRLSAARRAGPAATPGLPVLPVLPRLHIDGHYLAAESPHPDGGAWLDVISLADGRAVMFVGDMARGKAREIGFGEDHHVSDRTRHGRQGRGAEAPSLAGELRRNLGRLLAGDDLATVLDRVDRELDGGTAAVLSSVCVAVVDPQDGKVDYATYGHPPPLVLAPGNARYLSVAMGGRSLGLSPWVPVDTARLTPGEVLVLHSDGLSLDSRHAMATGLAEAARITDVVDSWVPAAMDSAVTTASVCRTTTAELRRAGSFDALAALAVQRRSELSRLAMTVPAVHRSLEAVDRTVGDWLSGLRSSVEDGVGVALAVGEAVTNAIQHAFIGQRVGSVRVEAELQNDGVLAFSVHDDGCWLPPGSSRPSYSGRGLSMIARLCDRMVVHRETTGTVLELRRRLHHPVVRSAPASPMG